MYKLKVGIRKQSMKVEREQRLLMKMKAYTFTPG
jgi:hypothetical protein